MFVVRIIGTETVRSLTKFNKAVGPRNSVHSRAVLLQELVL